MPAIPLGEFVDYLYIDKGAGFPLVSKEYMQPTHPIVAVPAKKNADLLQTNVKGVFTQALPTNRLSTPHQFIGIRFKPYGMFTGFGIKGKAIANRIVSSTDVFSDLDLECAAEMLYSGDDQSAIEYVHNALYDKLQPNPLLYEITEMVDTLVETDLSKNSQRYLAQAFERSPKSFIGVFKKAVGVTPLHYLHIHKIDAAKRLIREQPSMALTEVAYMLGFFDQSHFIRVFKKHTGHTPFHYKTGQVNSVLF
jgi:AraC-like DNA-binding protein